MASSDIALTEHRTSINICIGILNNVQLGIYLSAFFETQGITATGKCLISGPLTVQLGNNLQ